jgi:hypothetical protein
MPEQPQYTHSIKIEDTAKGSDYRYMFMQIVPVKQ